MATTSPTTTLPKPEELDIVFYPDPHLRRVAAPLTEITDDLCAIAERMIELMHRDNGVGLAGPQVALLKRMFVMNPSAERGEERVVLNPVVVKRSKAKEKAVEGCLSLPEINGKIERPHAITLRYYDLEGEEIEVDLEGFDARVAQHEFDHLEGVLIIDRMSAAERAVADRRLRELIRDRERALAES